MCYCNNSDSTILADILNETIPDEALTRSCCWKKICTIRGRHFSAVDGDVWSKICTKRGYILARENSRGF